MILFNLNRKCDTYKAKQIVKYIFCLIWKTIANVINKTKIWQNCEKVFKLHVFLFKVSAKL